VLRGWRTAQRQKPLIVFAHGNGFCAAVYRPFLDKLTAHYDVLSLDIPGHGGSDAVVPYPDLSATAELLHAAVQQAIQDVGQPVIGLGHSLGSVLGLLSAARHPASYRELVLLDPVMLPRTAIWLMIISNFFGVTDRYHPLLKGALNRRNGWASKAEAADYFKGRKVFEHWLDEGVQNYVDYALQGDENSGVTLCCDPSLEAHYFANPARGLWRAVKDLQCPTALIMGSDSFPMALRSSVKAQQVSKHISRVVVQGSHCFMQESPQIAADTVLQQLKR